ncbi:MAG: aldo/keto reductase [Planctomycetota bacterium]|jgi:aryl-alcohol dehydrogenase-like predicted oxidoreductase|nr:aldo/keto reductase [Planctomycetota bacterium]
MEKTRLGRTGLMVSRIAMGCIPIQRRTMADAAALIRRAFEAGVDFFDTAHVYGDSEAKLGSAFAGVPRGRIILATKAMADSRENCLEQLEESLRRLRTDYIDLYQWHNPANLDNFQENGVYQAMQEAKKAGKIRFIGVTNHHLGRARQAIESGGFDTLPFPLSVLSSREEIDMTFRCRDLDVGVIAMKAMCGGMLPDGRLAFSFLNQYPHIVPIWGLEKTEELEQFLSLAEKREPFTSAMQEEIEKVRQELGDEFCRGCGYCLPCQAGIDLPIMMRISYFVKRNVEGSQFNEARLKQVARIGDCVNCRDCVQRCPYHLEAPRILRRQRDEFNRLRQEFLAGI